MQNNRLNKDDQKMLASLINPDERTSNGTFNVADMLDHDTQTKIVAVMLFHEPFMRRLAEGITDKDFVERSHQVFVAICLAYWRRYKKLPTQQIVELEATRQAKTEAIETYFRAELKSLRETWLSVKFHGEERYWLDQTEEILAGIRQRRILYATTEALKRRNLSIGQIADMWQREAATIAEPDWALTLDQLPCKQVDWLIRDLIPAGSLIEIYGDSETGKSFACVDICLSIATGKPYLGKYDSKQGNALYFIGEGQASFAKRPRAWHKYYKIDYTASCRFVMQAYNLCKPQDCDKIIANINKLEHKPDIIVFDTLSKFFFGDENAASDMNALVRSCERIIQLYGCSVVLVHHIGKDATKGSRGSISKRNGVDTQIELRGRVNEGVEVHCAKQKDAKPFKSFAMRAKRIVVFPEKATDNDSIVFEYDNTIEIKRDEENHRKRCDKIAHWLTAIPSHNSEAIPTTDIDWGVNPPTRRKRIRTLLNQGMICRQEPNNPKHPGTVYRTVQGNRLILDRLGIESV